MPRGPFTFGNLFQLTQMEIATLIAAVAAFGLPCSNPQLRDYQAEEMPWPAAYIRSIEGHNIIALREGIRYARGSYEDSRA